MTAEKKSDDTRHGSDDDARARAERDRHDQLTTAPKSTEADAAPRIDVTRTPNGKRIDVRDDASARPGRGADE